MRFPIWLRRFLGEAVLLTSRELRSVDSATLLSRSRAVARSVYVGDGTVLCRVMGRYRMYVASDDVGFGVHVMLDGAWESSLTVFMARRIRPGMRIVDVGANHGYYTLMFAHLTGASGRVAAIEPNPRTAALLRRSLSVNGFSPWTEVFECAAVSQDDVQLGMTVPRGEPKNAHVNVDPAGASAGDVSVAGRRLDSMLASWPRVDFIKIDVEGAEEDCLEGTWPIITRDRPALVLEYNAYRSRDPGGLLDRLTEVYGTIGVITNRSEVIHVPRDQLEDRNRREDWMLFFEARP